MFKGKVNVSPVQNVLATLLGPLDGGVYLVSAVNLGPGTHTVRLTNPNETAGANNSIVAVHRFTATTVTGTTTIPPREISIPEGWDIGITSDSATPNVTGYLNVEKI